MQGSSSHHDDLKRKLDSVESEDSAIERKKQSLEKDKPSAVEAITVSMDCPAVSVGAIIGKKGANVQEIMRRSGCRIVIDQSDTREGVPKKVNLTGPPDKLAVAMALVSLIIKDGANALFAEGQPADSSSVKATLLQSESRCPKSKVGEVIGIKGATIAEIMRRSSCKVRIVQEAADGNILERQVVYNGTIEQISEAKALVQTVIDQGVSVLGIIVADHRRTADSHAPVTVDEKIEVDKVGIVIGTKGSMITDIMKRSGAKILINQDFPKGQPHRIVYSGQKEQVDMAKSLVNAVITKGPSGISEYYTSQTVEEMNVLQKFTGRVLGPQGATIKEMQSRFGVKMNIQVSESAKGGEEGAINILKMTGTVDAVQNVRKCVSHILGGGSLDSYPFPNSMGYSGMPLMNHNGGYAPPNPQFPYGKPTVPPFNGGAQFYPPALTPSGYGQMPPMMQNQPINYGPPMNLNPVPHYGAPIGQIPQGPVPMVPNTTPNYGNPVPQSAPPAYRAQPAPSITAPTPQGASLGLGADGTSGVLEPPVTQADGTHTQVANVRVDVIGKIIGKAGVNITLIKTKSGASVQVVKSPVPDPNGYTKVVMAGAAADVYLATQMIQEILVNGPSKLSQLPDKPQSGANNYPGAAAAAAAAAGPIGAVGYKAPQAQGQPQGQGIPGNQGYPGQYTTESTYSAPSAYGQYPAMQGGPVQGSGQGQYPQGGMYGQIGQQYAQPTGYPAAMVPQPGQPQAGPPGMPYNYAQQQYQR